MKARIVALVLSAVITSPFGIWPSQIEGAAIESPSSPASASDATKERSTEANTPATAVEERPSRKSETTPAKDTLPAKVQGRFYMVVKGELLLYLDGKAIPFHSNVSQEVSLAPGDVIVVRIYTTFVYRAFRMAFVSTDGRWIIPFTRAHFVKVEGEPQTIASAEVKRSTENPKAGRPDPNFREIWSEMNLHADEAEWMWGAAAKQRYQYACAVDQELFKTSTPGETSPASAAATPTTTAAQTPTKVSTAATKPASAKKRPPAEKTPVPSEDVQRLAAAKVEKVCKLNSAHTPAEKANLARNLFQQYREGSLPAQIRDDAAATFVLLFKTAELASDGGDGQLMTKLVDALDKIYDIHVVMMKADMIDRLAAGGKEPARIKSLFECSRNLIGGGILRQPDISYAGWMVHGFERLATVCEQPEGAGIRDEARAWLSDWQVEQPFWREMAKHQETLRQNPDDPEANHAVARWYRREGKTIKTTERMILCLAKCGEPDLVAAAKADLANPTDPLEQLRVADLWAATAKTHSIHNEDADYFERCNFWYRKALPGLTGANKSRVESVLNLDVTRKPGLVAFVFLDTPEGRLHTHLYGIVQSADDFKWLRRKALEK